jgi:hypothetical protein
VGYQKDMYRKKFRIFTPIFIVILLNSYIVACTRYAPKDSSTRRSPSTTIDSPVPVKVIEGDPLVIYVAEDASYQIEFRNADNSLTGQVYPPFAKNADSGLFVKYNNLVLGPNFEEDYRISVANIYDTWDLTNQTELTGTGSRVDPWVIGTQLSHSSGITMTTQTSYINGDNFFIIAWDICVIDPTQISTFLAGDYSLDVENNWNGFFDNLTKSVGAINTDRNWVESFTPRNDAVHYQATEPQLVWDAIGSQGSPGPGFNDSLSIDESSIAAGLQWDLSINDCATTSAQWCFGPDGACPPSPLVKERYFLPYIQK